MHNNNLTFLKSIITSDFSAINPVFLKPATAPIQITAGFSKQQIHGNLDLLVLNRSLKQFVRTLQFFNKRKGVFNIFVKQNSLFLLLTGLLSDLTKSKRVLLNQVVIKTEYLHLRRRYVKPSLLLDKEFSKISYLSKFQQNSSYLINIINLIQNITADGRYRTFNDIISLEKRVFLSILLRSTIKAPQIKSKNDTNVVSTKKKQKKLFKPLKELKVTKMFADRETVAAVN